MINFDHILDDRDMLQEKTHKKDCFYILLYLTIAIAILAIAILAIYKDIHNQKNELERYKAEIKQDIEELYLRSER